MSINRVTLSGNLTRDPDLRSTAAGSTILGFGIAVNERVKNGTTGEWEDRPNFVDCTVFGARAESLSRILRKGMKVALEGRLRYSSWEKDGQKRSKLEVIVDQIDLMQRKGDGQGNDPMGGMTERDIKRAAGGNINYASNYDDDMFSDDIPF
jgi:single-strand DNA-binding protein